MASWCRLVRWPHADAGPRNLAAHPLLSDRLQETIVGGLLAATDRARYGTSPSETLRR